MKKLLCILAIALAAPFCMAANPVVRLSTNVGDIDLELYPEKAPITVENFLRYVKKNYYSGTVFHRVIPGFVAQAGGYTADIKDKPAGKTIQNEADNGLSNQLGTVAMARQNTPHSATSQFFINLNNNTGLDYRDKETGRGWGYAVFGKVVQGMEVVEKIAATPTSRINNMSDVPTMPIVIKSARLLPEAKAADVVAEPAKP
ncbi:peptidylprolyl isomerase [Chitinimonas naiadis]